MSVAVAGLRPPSAAISTWEGCFVLMQSNMVLQAAEFAESFLAGRGFASPNAIHSLSDRVAFVCDNVVGVLGALESLLDGFLLDLIELECFFLRNWI